MKLADLDVIVTAPPAPGWGGRYWILVKVTSNNGIVGWGECYASTVGPYAMEPVIRDVFARYFEGVHHQVRQRPHQIIGATVQLQRVVDGRNAERSRLGKRWPYGGIEGFQNIAQQQRRHDGAATADEAQHGFDERFRMLQAVRHPPTDVVALLGRQIVAAQLSEIQGRGGKRSADLMGQTSCHFTEGGESMTTYWKRSLSRCSS